MLSQAETLITIVLFFCKTKQIHKMTTIFTQNIIFLTKDQLLTKFSLINAKNIDYGLLRLQHLHLMPKQKKCDAKKLKSVQIPDAYKLEKVSRSCG